MDQKYVRGWVDLDRGVIFRRAEGERVAHNKRKPPVKMARRLLAHMQRWKRLDGWTDDTSGLRNVVHYLGKPIVKENKAFRSTIAAAGLPSTVTPHVLRHTRGTWLAQRGVSPNKAAESLGMTVENTSAPTYTVTRTSNKKLLTRIDGTSGAPHRFRTASRNMARTNRDQPDLDCPDLMGFVGAYHVRDDGVAGSNPATPTRISKGSRPILVPTEVSRTVSAPFHRISARYGRRWGLKDVAPGQIDGC